MPTLGEEVMTVDRGWRGDGEMVLNGDGGIIGPGIILPGPKGGVGAVARSIAPGVGGKLGIIRGGPIRRVVVVLPPPRRPPPPSRLPSCACATMGVEQRVNKPSAVKLASRISVFRTGENMRLFTIGSVLGKLSWSCT